MDGRVRRKNSKRTYAQDRKYNLQSRYGMTMGEFADRAAGQGGKCAGCGRRPHEPLRVDHSHSSGKVRRLLCARCNLKAGK